MLLLYEIENTFISLDMVAEVVCSTGGERDDPGSQLTAHRNLVTYFQDQTTWKLRIVQ